MKSISRFDSLIHAEQEREAGLPPSHPRHLALLRETLDKYWPGATLLDAGCGHGDYLPLYRELGFRAVGIDLSPVVLRSAQRQTSAPFVEIASLEQGLPHQNRSFDFVVCCQVLENLRDVHSVLSEFNRVLVDDGLLILTASHHGWLKNVLIAMLGFEKHYYPHNYRLRFFTPRSLTVALERAGFVMESWRGGEGHWPLWQTMYVVARKADYPEVGPNPLSAEG